MYEARQLLRARRLSDARAAYREVLADAPWKRDALIGLADLEYRRGRYAEGLESARRALELDTYDAGANFVAGLLYRELGRGLDARESFGWAARDIAYRAVAHQQLAELAMAGGDPTKAGKHARTALSYDAASAIPRRLLATLARLEGDSIRRREVLSELEALDPLDPFARAERFLAAPEVGAEVQESGGLAGGLAGGFAGEFAEQEVLEVALAYARLGRADDAVRLLRPLAARLDNPVVHGWLAMLSGDPALLESAGTPELVFPYRRETLAMLGWAAETSDHWVWRYLLALNLWGRDRESEALRVMVELGGEPDYAPFYATRGLLATRSAVSDAEADLVRAVRLDPSDRNLRFPLVTFLQNAARWDDALAASGEALEAFPADFDLELLHVAALVETGRHASAIELLDGIRVLPSEHSSRARTLFAQAHTMAGLAALDAGDAATAAVRFRTATTWPERLGQGRPYEPEERLQRFALGHALALAGDAPGARAAFEAVVDATPGAADGVVRSPYDALGHAALLRLGTVAAPEALAAEFARIAGGQPAGLGTVEDRLLLRVLALTDGAGEG